MTDPEELKLTDAQIRGAKPKPARNPDGTPKLNPDGTPKLTDAWLHDGRGLYVRVRLSGRKVFVIRSKRGNETLGQHPDYSLKKARTVARKRWEARRKGGPAPRDDKTLAELAAEYIKRRVRRDYAPKTQSAMESHINNKILPTLGADNPLHSITRRNIADLYKRYGKRAPVEANRMRDTTRKLFDYAFQAGYLEDDPTLRVSRDMAGGKEHPRTRVLTDDEIRAVWAAEHTAADALKLILLTGQRPGEVRQMRWDYVDIEAATWTIPAELAKNNRAHTVHLTAPALDIVKRQQGRHKELVFYGSKGWFTDGTLPDWTRKWCDKNKITPRFVPHDLRRTFVTRANELDGVLPHITERCVNHVLPGMERVYNRAQYRDACRELWERWADEVRRIVGEPLSVEDLI